MPSRIEYDINEEADIDLKVTVKDRWLSVTQTDDTEIIRLALPSHPSIRLVFEVS